MADLTFFFAFEFGKSLIKTVRYEYRIIAKTVYPTRTFSYDASAFPLCLHDYHTVRARNCDGTNESRFTINRFLPGN